MNAQVPHPGLHRCARLPDSGVTVAFGQARGEVRQRAWHLLLVREATEADLDQSSLLEEVGEAMWSLCAEILCCPYCGATLPGADAIEPAVDDPDIDAEADKGVPFGAFALLDQEAWSARLR